MARGWESKSVEAQQDDARSASRTGQPAILSGEERDRAARRRVLQLARARTAADLEKAEAPAQRDMLERALADLDRTIEGLAVRPS